MGLLNLFKKKSKSAPKGGKDAAIVDGTSSEGSQGASAAVASVKVGREKKQRRKSKTGKCQKEEIEKSENVKVVEEFFQRFNSFESVESLEEMFLHPDQSKFRLEDGFSMTPKEWAEGSLLVYNSFPNMKFEFKELKETGPNEVVAEGLNFSGTHTGAPFTFAPPFPEIPTTGIHVVNDEERFVFRLKDGKIDVLTVIALGTYTGPPGVYEQVGGRLVPPEE